MTRRCPCCQSFTTWRVIDSRKPLRIGRGIQAAGVLDIRRRRYRCEDCRGRFSTTETIDPSTVRKAHP